MDLSKLSDQDLEALSKNDLSRVSDDGLAILYKPAPIEIAEFSPAKTMAGAVADALTQPMMGNKDAQERVGPIVEGDAPLLLPGAVAPRLLAAGTRLAASPIARTATSTAVGGAEGFLGGPTDQTLDERLENAKAGAQRGLLMGAGSEMVAGGASALAKGARKVATGAAFKAMGPDFRSARQNMEKGKVDDIGATLLDEGVIEGYAPRGAESLGKRLGEFKTRARVDLNDVISQLDEAGQKVAAGGGKGGLSRSSIAKSLRDDLINPNLEIPGIKAQNKEISKLIDEFERGGDELINILRGEGLKKSAGKEIKWDRMPGSDIPLNEQVTRALYTKLKQGVEDGARVFEKAGHGPGVDRFVKAKTTYGNLKEAQNIASKRASRDTANRMVSPSDYLTGVAGGAVGFASGDDMESRLTNMTVGLGVGGANKLLRTYGNQPVAAAFNSASKKLAATGRYADLVRKNPALVQSLSGIVSRGVAGIDQISPAMMDAFRKDPALLDGISDPALRAKIETRMGGAPKRSPGAEPKGEAKWASDGAQKLGLGGASLDRLMSSPKGKRLLIEASELKPGSKAMQRVQEQIQKELETR